jgi:hypothetical protein
MLESAHEGEILYTGIMLIGVLINRIFTRKIVELLFY